MTDAYQSLTIEVNLDTKKFNKEIKKAELQVEQFAQKISSKSFNLFNIDNNQLQSELNQAERLIKSYFNKISHQQLTKIKNNKFVSHSANGDAINRMGTYNVASQHINTQNNIFNSQIVQKQFSNNKHNSQNLSKYSSVDSINDRLKEKVSDGTSSSIFNKILGFGGALIASINMIGNIKNYSNMASSVGFLANKTRSDSSELYAIGQSASRFGGDPEETYSFVDSLRTQSLEAKFGKGDPRLMGLLNATNTHLTNNNNEIRPITDILLDIGKGLQGKSNDVQQIIALKYGMPDSLMRLLTQDPSIVQDNIIDSKKRFELTKIDADNAIKLQNSLKDLNQEFTILAATITTVLVPILHGLNQSILYVKQGISEDSRIATDAIEWSVNSFKNISNKNNNVSFYPAHNSLLLNNKTKDLSNIISNKSHYYSDEDITYAYKHAKIAVENTRDAQSMVESHGNNVFGDGGKSEGIFQIQAPTANSQLGYKLNYGDIFNNPALGRKIRDELMFKYSFNYALSNSHASDYDIQKYSLKKYNGAGKAAENYADKVINVEIHNLYSNAHSSKELLNELISKSKIDLNNNQSPIRY
jgi:hypothetical protein